jgi:hypothetical protein
MSNFKPARPSPYCRVALVGPSGSGKTYSALSLARSKGLSVALITLEGSESAPCPVDTLEVTGVAGIIHGLSLAAQDGYGMVVLDCLSSVWTGPSGLLALVDQHQSRGWGMVDAELGKLYAAIQAFPGHVLATFRAEEIRLVTEKDGAHRVVTQVGKVAFKADFGARFDTILEMCGAVADCKKGPPAVYGRLWPQPGAELAALLFPQPESAKEAAPETASHPSETGTSTPSSGSKTNGQSGEAITIKNLREAARDLVGAGFSVDRVTVVLATHGGEFSDKGALVGMPVAHRPACLSEMIALACEGTGVAL